MYISPARSWSGGYETVVGYVLAACDRLMSGLDGLVGLVQKQAATRMHVCARRVERA
jgi:hypothetical protein